MQIRGISDMTLDNSPLYIVDGMPINSYITRFILLEYSSIFHLTDGLSFLNIDDIEEISVIKGFTPLLLNGNIGANGVVMITTKRGQAGRLSINYSNSTQFSSPLMMPEFQNNYGSEDGDFTSWGPKLSVPSKYDPKDFFRTGFSTMNTLSISGGNKYNQTYASMGVTNGQNILPNNGVDRYNTTLRNSLNLFDGRLRFDLGAMWMKVKEKNLAMTTFKMSPLQTLYLFPRGEKIDQIRFGDKLMSQYEEYDAEFGGKVPVFPDEYLAWGFQNPYWKVHHQLAPATNERYMFDAGLNYQLTNWLSVSGNYRYESTDSRQEHIMDPEKYFSNNNENNYDSYYAERKNNMKLNTYQLQVNAYKKINDFSISGTLGYFYANQNNNFEDQEKTVCYLNSLNNIIEGFSSASRHTNRIKSSQSSLSSVLSFGYQDKYFLYLKNNWYKSSRSSVTLLKNSTNAFLPNLGASFILTDIFPIKSDFLPFLRLNGSYCMNSDYRPDYSRCNYIFSNGSSGYYPSDGAFYDISSVTFFEKYKKTRSGEISLEGSLLNNLFDFNVELYQSTTKSVFGSYEGTDEIRNKGIEISLGIHQPLGSVNWNSRLNYSLNQTLLKSVSRLHFPYGLYNIDYFSADLVPKKPYGDISGSYFSMDELGNIIVDPNTLTLSFGGVKSLGNFTPKWNLTWQNDFSWRGFSLGMLVNARIGGECMSYTESILDYYGVSKKSGEARDNGGVIVSGYKIPVENYYSSASRVTAPYVYSATNIRLAELSLSYDIPIERWTKFVKGLNVSFIGRNLLMLYCKAPFDPELITNLDGQYLGMDKFMLPSLRSIGFAVNARF